LVTLLGLADAGNEVEHKTFFDTLKVNPLLDVSEIRNRASEVKINLRYFEDGTVGVSLDETTKREDIADLLWVFAVPKTLNQVRLFYESLQSFCPANNARSRLLSAYVKCSIMQHHLFQEAFAAH